MKRGKKGKFGYAIPFTLLGMCVGCLSESVNGNDATMFGSILIGAIVGAIVGFGLDVSGIC